MPFLFISGLLDLERKNYRKRKIRIKYFPTAIKKVPDIRNYINPSRLKY